jgi:Sigma-70, region 4
MAEDRLESQVGVAEAALPNEEPPQPEVAKIRLKVRPSRDGRFRSKTIAPKRLTRDEKRLALSLIYPDDIERPKLRAECQNMERPCPFVSCEHHLYLDVNPQSGAIKLNFPHLEVWEMAETCALDVADRGGITLEEVGAILNLTRERIRQVEVRGLSKIRAQSGDDLGPSTSFKSPTKS